MGGGDLNTKKSWHPNTMKNQERVWKAEQAAAEEKKRIVELQREREEERDRAQLKEMAQKNFGANSGTQTDNRLHWMYDKPDKQAQDEDYLLGKAIGKNDDSDAQQNSIPAVSRRVVGSSMNSTGDDTQVDLARKLREDPLLLVKERERAARAALLNNPLQRKKLAELLRKEQEQKMSKPKKKSKKKSKDLDNALAEKLSALAGKKGIDINSLLNSDDSSDSSSDSDAKSKKKKKKRKRDKKKSKKKRKSSESDSESSDDDSVNKRLLKCKKYSKENMDYSDDHSAQTRKNRDRKDSNDMPKRKVERDEPPLRKKVPRDNSPSRSREQRYVIPPKSDQRDDSSPRRNHRGTPTRKMRQREYSPQGNRNVHEDLSSKRKYERDHSPARKTQKYNSSPGRGQRADSPRKSHHSRTKWLSPRRDRRDNSSPGRNDRMIDSSRKRSSTEHTPPTSRKARSHRDGRKSESPSSQRKGSVSRKKQERSQGLSEEEKAARIAEMAAAGAEREAERGRRVARQRADDAAAERRGPAPRNDARALPDSLEARIRSNRHYIQRDTQHMNQHFARR